MGGIIDSIRESVKYIRSSQAREELFDFVVEKLGIECTKKPSLDVASRWNSRYLMIESVFPYQEAFVKLGKQDKQFTFAPSEKHWALAEELRKLLQTFFVATKVVSGTKYPTSNRYFHEIWNVKVLSDRQAKNTNVIIASMVYEMQEIFDKYRKESYLENCIPLILDPRYNHGFVKFRLEHALGKKDSEHHIAKVDEVMHKLFEEYSIQIGESAVDSSEEEDGVDAVPEAENPLVDWESHHNVQKKQVASKLDRYLNEDLFPKRKVFDILGWSKINASKFPILSCIARDLLVVQASTVVSEPSFSIGGRVVSDYRSRLKSGTVKGI
nr:zinc finger BED domain-containing protein RICESLEEPER 2-like [Lolium perenne]